jgi:polar amino acid transport system permease protein
MHHPLERPGDGFRCAQPILRGTNGTLPVLKPFRPQPTVHGVPFTAHHGVLLLLALLVATSVGEAQAGSGAPSIIATMLRWTPLLAQGFALNITMSFLAMAIGTALGLPLGLGLISVTWPVRAISWLVTQFFRNAPWLVLLFYCILLMPFEIRIGTAIVPLPGWAKATAGLALPVMANVAELVRGAVRSIPAGQWEAAEALAFRRPQTLWLIILPQCVKRMTPPWMNLYAIVVVGTPLASIVGVGEAMTLTGDILSSENRTELLVPMYLYLLMWFFAYCYPIARATAALERRFQVPS